MAQREWGTHLVQQILPWWESRAIDEESGGVFTCFDNRGTLVSDEKYTWSQGRWAWLAAELARDAEAGRLPIDGDVWRDRAVATARFLERTLTGDGRTAYRTDRAGHHLSDGTGDVATSIFADLFCVLGWAGAMPYGTGDEQRRWREESVRVLETAEAAVTDRTARTDPYPVPAGYLSIAEPMNLLHASAELLRSCPEDEQVRAVRDRALDTLHDQFIGPDLWWEFRPVEPPADPESLLARHRTPGHLLELLWMLHRAEEDQAARRLDPDTYAELTRRALAVGWDEELGGILRYVDIDGGPPRADLVVGDAGPYERLVTDTWDTKLWWVHAEAMYGVELMAQVCGDADLAAWSDRVADWTMATFPDRDQGEWLQIRDRRGDPLDKVVALPVKDPFHIARALILLNRLPACPTAEG